MKILTIVSLILIAAFGAFDVRAQDDNFSSDSDFEELYEYKPNPNRVGLKATFDDRVVGDLLNFVPAIVDMPKNRTIISSLLLSKVESFKSEAVSFRPRTAMLEGGDLLVAISPQLAERLDYQPVRLILYQSGVNRIVLARSDAIVDQVGAITRSYAQPDFFVRLRPNNGVAAVIKNPLSIKITNDIIQREFLYDQVQGIFLSDLGEMEASVVLTNGDTVSGKHNLPNELDFETPWGEESISIDQIESITRDRSIRLVPSGIDNPKFVIVRDNE